MEAPAAVKNQVNMVATKAKNMGSYSSKNSKFMSVQLFGVITKITESELKWDLIFIVLKSIK